MSYYDYYQPEAYIPQTDTYIEKDAKINEEIDRLRHSAVQDVLSRRDTIIVASVSCIYNIGSPEIYQKISLHLKQGQRISRKKLLTHLIALRYERNDIDFKPDSFRVRGDAIDIYLVTGQHILRIEMEGDTIKRLLIAKASLEPNFKPVKGEYELFPGNFWPAFEEKLPIAIENINLELQQQLKKLKKENKLIEAQRLEQRTNNDMEMLREAGFCQGIENYSRHMEFRKPGEAPHSLIDYFPKDYLLLIDESHQTLPQLRAMSVQDRARKEILIEHGFRLPSSIDNRPLNYGELEDRINQVVYISATPGKEERSMVEKKYVAEQLIRPTGLLEPAIEIRPTKNQVKNLISEIKERSKKGQRVLAITLTKRLSEALSEYLSEEGISSQYIHSEIKTLERPKILKNLREGKYDVLIGINLLREGLDLPEVSLVAILDADKEGFLRSEITLIQTMGRAARHIQGQVILYADHITGSMKAAMNEIKRRRDIQLRYNKEHNITPKPITKEIRNWPFMSEEKEVDAEFWMIKDKKLLEKEMKQAAKEMDFERATRIRDLIAGLDKKK